MIENEQIDDDAFNAALFAWYRVRFCGGAEPENYDLADFSAEFIEAMQVFLSAYLNAVPEEHTIIPPVSGGSHDLPEMDADETACGDRCQQLNDAAWAKLGPVDDVELPF